MDLIKIIILGIVQGLTEFLPISSSGHLVLTETILNYHADGIALEVFVHVGTLFSVLLAFRKDVAKMILVLFRPFSSKPMDEEEKGYLRWDLYVIIGTIPAVIVGLGFKDQIESFFSDPHLVLMLLAVTGVIMVSSRFIPARREDVSAPRSILIGIAQAFAILPGISRSGSTIVTALALGVEREKAARFSFILSLPAVFGAAILQIKDMLETSISGLQWFNLTVGAVAAFISGYLAILWLVDLVKRGKLEWFGYYCLLVSITGLIWMAV